MQRDIIKCKRTVKMSFLNLLWFLIINVEAFNLEPRLAVVKRYLKLFLKNRKFSFNGKLKKNRINKYVGASPQTSLMTTNTSPLVLNFKIFFVLALAGGFLSCWALTLLTFT